MFCINTTNQDIKRNKNKQIKIINQLILTNWLMILRFFFNFVFCIFVFFKNEQSRITNDNREPVHTYCLGVAYYDHMHRKKNKAQTENKATSHTGKSSING